MGSVLRLLIYIVPRRARSLANPIRADESLNYEINYTP